MRSDGGGARGRAAVRYRDLLGLITRVLGRALWVLTTDGGPPIPQNTSLSYQGPWKLNHHARGSTDLVASRDLQDKAFR